MVFHLHVLALQWIGDLPGCTLPLTNGWMDRLFPRSWDLTVNTSENLNLCPVLGVFAVMDKSAMGGDVMEISWSVFWNWIGKAVRQETSLEALHCLVVLLTFCPDCLFSIELTYAADI